MTAGLPTHFVKTFALHLLITAALAPAMGVAASSVFGAFDHGRFHPEQVLAGLFGGFFALAFIWFVTLPVGALTYFICRAALHFRWLTPWLWLPLWAGMGALLGFGLGRWSASLAHITAAVGMVVGALTGVVLHRIWSQEVRRAA